MITTDIELHVPRMGTLSIAYDTRAERAVSVRFLNGKAPDADIDVQRLNERAQDRLELAMYHNVEAALRERSEALRADAAAEYEEETHRA